MDVAGDMLPAVNDAAIRALENGSLGLGFSGAGFLLFYVSLGRVCAKSAREEGGLVASRRRPTRDGRGGDQNQAGALAHAPILP